MANSKTEQCTSRQIELAKVADALSHAVRIQILEILSDQESCICGDMVDQLPLAQSTVSQHLKVLKEAGLILGEIDGPRVCYCLNRRALSKASVDLQKLFNGLSGKTKQ